VSWWDTEHDKAASSDVATLALNVVPAAAANIAQNAVSDTAAPATGKPAPARAAGAVAAATKADDSQLRLWRALAIAAIALWLATLLGFFAWRRRGASAPPSRSTPASGADLEKASAARKAFLGACARDDAQSAARALLAWARTRGVAVRSLGELAARLGDADQRAALMALQRGLYAGASTTGLGTRLADAFGKDLSLSRDAARGAGADSVLPPLYPAT
jgi:hypothetical protein